MKVKKLIVSIVVMVLTITLAAGTALADSPWKGKDKPGNGKGNQVKVEVQKQYKDKDKDKEKDKNKDKVKVKVKKDRGCNFLDVSNNHWANKRIKAMALHGIIKGYAGGFFRPNASVSQIEALTMILRMEGADAEDLKEALRNQDVPKSVPLWAKGYAALAMDKGILTKKEAAKFQPMRAAKRYEVVIYLGRALDIDPEDNYEDLDFRDLKSIPDEALGYLPYLVEKGYFTGYHNGKFMPNKPVTRAEMATILSKIIANKDLDEDEDDVDVEIIDKFKAKGIITELNDEELVLKVNGKKKEFTVDPDDVIVFLDNKESTYSKLKEGYIALILCDSDREALVIYAHSKDIDDEDEDEEIEEVKGIFITTSRNGDQMRVLVNGNREKYDIDKNVEVEIDGDKAGLDDLLPGMKVELVIEDGKVVEIEADELEKFSGEFVDLNEDDIIVELDGVDFTFPLAIRVDVEIDNEEADLEDLERGMEVELEFDDGEVISIEAED